MSRQLKRVLFSLFFLILIISFAAGCTQQTTSSTDTTPSGELSIKTDVEIRDFKFNPQNVTVTAGTNVIWTNNDSGNHTIISTTGNEIDSGNVNPGETFTHIFNTPGTYEYHCSIHPTMTGTVVVE